MANVTPSKLSESNTNAEDQSSSINKNEDNSSSLNVEKVDSGWQVNDDVDLLDIDEQVEKKGINI